MKGALLPLPALLAAAGAIALPQKRDLTFDYSNDKVYGVNLGGWFVLEPWITPSMFPDDQDSVVDEYTLTQYLGSNAQSTMEKHWDSWITEDDFQQIASAGLNHVRVPIGYWAVTLEDGDPYVQGQLYRLDDAVTWARGAGLKMLIDLHGVPGSQNGFDNSGRKGSIDWQQVDSSDSTTKDVIDYLANRYASASDVVTSIEAVNEPMSSSLDMGAVKQYYYDAWGTIRNHNPDTALVIHDAFEDINTYWNGFMSGNSGVNNVILDTHIYQVFSDDEVAMSPSDHVSTACGQAGRLASTDKWTIVGEWTGAQTDCAQWLNGKGVGARYDGSYPGSSQVGSCDGKYTGSVDDLSSDDKANIRSLIEAQLDAYAAHTGWIYWTWKAESAPEWNMQAQIAGGLFPQPLDDRQYPGQCG